MNKPLRSQDVKMMGDDLVLANDNVLKDTAMTSFSTTVRICLIGLVSFLMLVLGLAISTDPVLAQSPSTGADGPLVITDTHYADEARTYLTSSALTGTTVLTVNSTTNFTVGDEVVILVMNGPNIDVIGTHETALIDDLSGNVITLSSVLVNGYTLPEYDVMVQKVPNYTTVIVENGGTLTAHAWDGNTGGLIFIKAQAMTVAGHISADGLGYRINEGPGVQNPSDGQGGHHAGKGGKNNYLPYGDIYQPFDLGSGGGTGGGYKPGVGGAGGGSIYLIVTNVLTLQNGATISANGLNGQGASRNAGGGGSGGSISVKVYSIISNGTIQAIGGRGANSGFWQGVAHGGGGSGGRVAIYTSLSHSYNIDIQTNGGTSDHYPGEPGTIYLNHVDPMTSTLEVSPVSVPANGVAQALITVTLKQTTGQVIANEPVSLTLTTNSDGEASQTYINGTALNTNASGLVYIGQTNANGVATATITSTHSATYTFWAYADIVRLVPKASVYFNPDYASADASTLDLAGPSQVAADGQASTTARITVRDAYDNLVPDIETNLVSNSDITIISTTQISNNSGEVFYTLKHNIPETVILTATLSVDGQVQTIPHTISVNFQNPDISLQQNVSFDHENAIAGYPLDYTISVENVNSMGASNVLVTDTLPASVTFDSAGPQPYHYNSLNHTVVWTVGTVAAGATKSLTMVVTLAETAPSQITNTLTATLNEADDNPVNNTNVLPISVYPAEPTLQIGPPPYNLFQNRILTVKQGTTQSLTATLDNNGTGVLLNPIIALPPHLSWVSINPTNTTSVDPNQSLVFTITAVSTSTQELGIYRDVITVTTDNDDPENLQLEVYVHPGLVDLTMPISNDKEEIVVGALLSLTKTTTYVLYQEGQYIGDYRQTEFDRPSDVNGQVLLDDLEVGVYTYDIWAENHLPQTGILTVTASMTQFVPPPLIGLPTIAFEPSVVEVGVVAGGNTYQQVAVRNNGPGDANTFILETPPNLPWLSSGWPLSVTQLAAGEAVTLTMFMNPPEDMLAGLYQEALTVTAVSETAGLTLTTVLEPQITVTTSQVADYSFEVFDITTDGPISQAKVTLINQSGRTVNSPNGTTVVYDQFTLVTTEIGRVLFKDIPLGEYNYYVSADSYYGETGLALVQALPAYTSTVQAYQPFVPGVLASPLLQGDGPPSWPGGSSGSGGAGGSSSHLTPDPFSYDWAVTEIEDGIIDTYAVEVVVDYTGEILEPALYVSPLMFCPGQGVDYLVANVGAITLTDISLNPSHEGVTFGPTTPVDVGTLAPGQAYTGTFTTNGNGEVAPEGLLSATSHYTGEDGELYDYESSAFSRVGCNETEPANTPKWSWQWVQEQSQVRGQYQGKEPRYPGQSIPSPSPPELPELARLTLSGDATLERQAFLASLSLNSQSAYSVTDIQVNIGVRNSDGLFIVGKGFVALPEVPTELGDLPPYSNLSKNWTLIPNELGIENPEGESFFVQAQMVYTYQGQVYTTTTLPEKIVVLPQPRVKLSFSHSQPDDNNEFYLQVHAENLGYGSAKNLTLDLSNIQALPDLDNNQHNLIWDLLKTTIDGQTEPTEYVLRFGDIASKTVKVGRWDIKIKSSQGLPLLNPWITSFDVSCHHLPYEGEELSDLLFCGEIEQYFLAGECPFCGLNDKNKEVGGPINTANGNYHYKQSTVSVPTVGDPLQFTWSYNSLNWGLLNGVPLLTSTLGTAWTHNYDLFLQIEPEKLELSTATNLDDPPDSYTGTLDLSAWPMNQTDHRVYFKSFHGTPLNFEWVQNDYRPAAGVRGSLTRTETLLGGYVYTLTAASQQTYVFTTSNAQATRARITRQFDPQGNVITYSYNPQGQLSQIIEPISGRYLNFSYNNQGQLIAVSDPLGRITGFGYNGANQLSTITNTRGYTWTYDYTTVQLSPAISGLTSINILSRVTDPEGRIVEETGFDGQGRAITQTYWGENLSIEYFEDGRRIITDGLQRQSYHVYNDQLLLVGTSDALGHEDRFVLDENANRVQSKDSRGNLTQYERDPNGYTTGMQDALGNTTSFEYDSNNNLIKSVDARGRSTHYLYNGQNNLISTTNALGYTSLTSYNENGQILSQTNENGNTTRYGYDEIGQQVVITDALGYTTHYGYDAIGRLITTTDALGKVSINVYDDGNNLIQSIGNLHPLTPTQNYLNEYNLITEYGYDKAGRQVVMTDTVGRVSRSVYNENGRLVQSIQNVHPSISVQNYQNQYNLITRYGYDELGNQVVVTDTIGRENRTFYDELNRVEKSVTNYVDGIFDENQPDEDIVTTYNYDANGNLLSSPDLLGRENRNFYDELNRVAKSIQNYVDGVYDPAKPDEDIITTYTYDENGNQKRVTDVLSRTTSYDYDDLNRVITVTNALGYQSHTVYDPAGQRISSIDPQDRTTSYGYDALNRVVTTTNALGDKAYVVYNEVGNRIHTINAKGQRMTYTYDSLYRTTAVTDAEGQVTERVYNALGQQIESIDAEENSTYFTYDSLNRPITVTNALSGTTGTVYDALGRRVYSINPNGERIHYEYDGLNRVIQATDPNSLTTVTEYDGLGRRVSVSNDLGETTKFEYDNLDRLIKTYDPLSHTAVFTYDGAGQRLATLDAEGVETRYEYDDLGRLIAVIEAYENGVYNPAQTDEDIITRYGYDKVGNRTILTTALSYTNVYTYDDLNRRIAKQDELGNVTRYGYDELGNQRAITSANSIITTFDYDRVNRLTQINYSDSTPDVSFTYNKVGQRLTMSDGTGNTSYTYDDLYRLKQVENGAGQVISYTYDAVGNRTNLIYPDGKVVTYTYDAGNRLEQVTDWQAGLYAYAYDAANRLDSLSLPNGVTSNYEYDEAGRLTLLTHSTLTETLASYSYALDDTGNRQLLTESLLIPSIGFVGAYLETDGVVVVEAEHTEHISQPQAAISNWQAVTALSGFTGTGYLQALPDIGALYSPSEPKPAATYALNITNPGSYTVWVRGYAHSASGDSAYISLNNETATVTGFAPRSWTWVSAVDQVTIPASGVYSLTLGIREDGFRVDKILLTTDTAYLPTGFGLPESITQTNVVDSLTRTIDYDYDQLYRLTQASYTSGETYQYSYDAVGNRLQEIINGDTTSYIYDEANRIASVDGVSYTYDDNGNLLTSDTMTNTWDAANRLTTIMRAGESAVSELEPSYDGLNNRVAQTKGTSTTYYTLDVALGLPEVIYTSDGNTYLHLAGVIVTQSDNGPTRYLLSDGLGSVRHVTDETAKLLAYREYDPYGKPLTTPLPSTPYAFTGEWWEADLNLLYLRARWYAPEMGTFLSVDAVESEPAYQYVGGNVVNRIDPSGHYPIQIWASAFIKPNWITFPHPSAFVWDARWHGDGRDFYTGGALPSARVWHNIVIDTDPRLPSAVVSNDADALYTLATWEKDGSTFVEIGTAPPPPKAQVKRGECIIIVELEAQAANPLTPPGTPNIDYEYSLVFDILEGEMTYEGSHDWFPWHELYVNTVGALINSAPFGPAKTPADLIIPSWPVSRKVVNIPIIAGIDECLCSQSSWQTE